MDCKEIKKTYIYFVTFEVHRDCQIRTVVWHCEAPNANEAKHMCQKTWYTNCKSSRKQPHQFHMYAKRSHIQGPSLLRVHDWLNREICGEQVMNSFIRTDLRTWRVDGQNLYGATRTPFVPFRT